MREGYSTCSVCVSVFSLFWHLAQSGIQTAVSAIKSLLKKCNDPYLALLAYRSTPLAIGYSPVELLMSRILRSTVPTTREQRQPRIPDREEVERQDLNLKNRQKENHDTHHGTRRLPPLTPGESLDI